MVALRRLESGCVGGDVGPVASFVLVVGAFADIDNIHLGAWIAVAGVLVGGFNCPNFEQGAAFFALVQHDLLSRSIARVHV